MGPIRPIHNPIALSTADLELDPVFAPPEDLIDRILHDLVGPDSTLRGIAITCNTSLPAFVAWLARPDIAERLAALNSAAADRIRLVALDVLPVAISAALEVIAQYEYDQSHVLARSSSVRDAEFRRRGAETARRAATLLARLASLRTTPSRRVGGEGAGGEGGAGGAAGGRDRGCACQCGCAPESPVREHRAHTPDATPALTPRSATAHSAGDGVSPSDPHRIDAVLGVTAARSPIAPAPLGHAPDACDPPESPVREHRAGAADPLATAPAPALAHHPAAAALPPAPAPAPAHHAPASPRLHQPRHRADPVPNVSAPLPDLSPMGPLGPIGPLRPVVPALPAPDTS